ncbi:thiolase family protein [Tomitella fengzijianii]|uniref:Thiolase family protein n=1 Tax=Tomitella fengzijianii TaxID=2597660 RepID=A0A516X6Y0_9ACTN|nr:thiolase family protein [Tomitella fengzijianii]QDQ98816.1 thiolase family protein [Tomitella fengzijianii]
MNGHPFRDVAVSAVYNTPQARVLEGHDSVTITVDAARGVIAEAGVDVSSIDGVFGQSASSAVYALGLGPVWCSNTRGGIAGILQAASVIAAGLCTTVLIADGEAGLYTDRSATAPWTRPSNEFVAPFGLYTAVEFALIARRHMHRYGTTPEQLAAVAARIRNNGHINPEAVYRGRGPFSIDDVLSSRMIADPFRLLDCATTSEGGCALILTTAARAADLPGEPVYILGGGLDSMGPQYRHAPDWDLVSRTDDIPNGYVGRRAARQAFAMAGIGPEDVDVAELYDPFSFELIRQFEAFGFCKDGEGGAFATERVTGDDPALPITTDGGLMSYSHGGGVVQLNQRVARGVQQLQGTCRSNQVAGARTVLCSNGGAGALFTDVLLLGSERP